MKVTFIGLGIMGSRMAVNLLKNGVDLTVYNRTEAASRDLENKGAKRAKSANDAVKEADYVFTMLSEPAVLSEVMLKPDNGIYRMKKNALWIDCSTVNPSFSRECKRRCDQVNIRFIDAPVTGTKPSAERGELVFLAGGDNSSLGEVKTLLEYMGNKILYLGEAGMGTSFKMLVNSMLAQSMIIFAETIVLGEKMGFDPEFLFSTIPDLPVSAPFLKTKAVMMKINNYDLQFPLEHMHKDLRLVNETAREYDQMLVMANQAKQIYERAEAGGFGREDFSAIYKFILGSKQN